ncbi:hypothetical protein RJ639_008980 [Escallonia herrerae]|uniref:VQ domain-containing protein n=1 Tax=Escallonia herrerae TaxID=1293975 RepID=A0AA89ATA4_9ASTE|nr:hypothetical protein RJ639_008980 [Escallonia herrerae]
MASSENLATMEPWTFRPTFTHSWISEAFARDTETLTKALQKSLSSPSDTITDTMAPFFNLPKSETVSGQTPSGSGSEPETPAPRRRNALTGTAGGKVTKRKSRASKRTTTTFIQADPANFRQMVQQVTGVRFGNGQQPVGSVFKPEPQRGFNRLQGCLPTLDTSAFLLDHHQQVVGSGSAVQPRVSVQPWAMVGDGGAGFDLESFPSFPTLESWKVM